MLQIIFEIAIIKVYIDIEHLDEMDYASKEIIASHEHKPKLI
jgi:hypothetical protein